MKNMDKVTESGDEGSVGRLWDMASAKLSKNRPNGNEASCGVSKQAIKAFKRSLKTRSHGWLRRWSFSAQSPCRRTTDGWREEWWGSRCHCWNHESDDLNKMLPNETMFLAYPELEVIFYKHLADKRLLSYSFASKSRTLRKVKSSKARQ